MRQAGIIAAGALYALQNNLDRIKEDHQKAKILAEAIGRSEFFEIDLNFVHTNIVIWNVNSQKTTAEQVVKRLGENRILILDIGNNRIRAVCHLDVSFEDMNYTAEMMRKLF